MPPKDADGMADSVGADQTAPSGAVKEQSDPDLHCRSSLIWVYTGCPDLSIRKLRVITVFHSQSLDTYTE